MKWKLQKKANNQKSQQHRLAPVPFHRGTSRLGIDIGRVICITDTDNTAGRAGFLAAVRAAKVSADCVAAVRALTRHFGPENTFLVSKCGADMQQSSVFMLGANDFFRKTGVRPEHALFCFKREGALPKGSVLQMRPISRPDYCAVEGPAALAFGKALTTVDTNVGKGAVATTYKLTHMIDDRAQVLLGFHKEGHLASLAAPSRHGALLHFGPTAVDCSCPKARPMWRRCGGAPAEAWRQVLGCFRLLGSGSSKGKNKKSKAEREEERAAREIARQEKQRQARLKQKRQQALSKVKSNKLTYDAVAGWLEIRCKFLPAEADPTFEVTLPQWLARRDEFMERAEADDVMLLEVHELEEFLVQAAKELSVAYFGAGFEFDPLFSELKSIVESNRQIGKREGLPPWVRCVSDQLSPDEMELACSALTDHADDGDEQSWDETDESDSSSSDGTTSDDSSDDDSSDDE